MLELISGLQSQLSVLEQLRARSSNSHNLICDTGLHHRLKSCICHKFKIKKSEVTSVCFLSQLWTITEFTRI